MKRLALFLAVAVAAQCALALPAGAAPRGGGARPPAFHPAPPRPAPPRPAPNPGFNVDRSDYKRPPAPAPRPNPNPNPNRPNTNPNRPNNNTNNRYNTGTVNRTTINNSHTVNRVVINNPVYYNGPAWGWNNGMVWAPAYGYYGGGFWGALAIGAASAAIYGSLVANDQTYTSYLVQPSSPGATLLANYQLTQTQCGPPNLVVIYGPDNSVICAYPNNLVAAGYYNLDPQTLSLTGQ
jgi:hypothetical protein